MLKTSQSQTHNDQPDTTPELLERLIKCESENLAMKNELAAVKKELASITTHLGFVTASPQKKLELLALNGVTKDELFGLLFNTQSNGTTLAHYIAQGRDKALLKTMLSLISSLPVEDRVPFYMECDVYNNTLCHYFLGADMGAQPGYAAPVDLDVFDGINAFPPSTVNKILSIENNSKKNLATLAFYHKDMNAFIAYMNSLTCTIPDLNKVFLLLIYPFNVSRLVYFIKFLDGRPEDEWKKIFAVPDWKENELTFNELSNDAKWNDIQLCINVLPASIQSTILNYIGSKLSGETFIAFVNYLGTQPETTQLNILKSNSRTPNIHVYFRNLGVNECLALLTLLKTMTRSAQDNLLSFTDEGRRHAGHIIFEKKCSTGDIDAYSKVRHAWLSLLFENCQSKTVTRETFMPYKSLNSRLNLLREEAQTVCLYLMLCDRNYVINFCLKKYTDDQLNSLRVRLVDYIKGTDNVNLQIKIQQSFRVGHSALYKLLRSGPSAPSGFLSKPKTYVDEIMEIQTKPVADTNPVAAEQPARTGLFGFWQGSNKNQQKPAICEENPLLNNLEQEGLRSA